MAGLGEVSLARWSLLVLLLVWSQLHAASPVAANAPRRPPCPTAAPITIDGQVWDLHLRLLGAPNGYLVVPILSAGLGNRLRLTASALQLAQDSGRVCVVLWYPSPSCNARFTDLFLPPATPPLTTTTNSSSSSSHASPFSCPSSGDGEGEEAWRGLVMRDHDDDLHSPFALAMRQLYLDDSARSMDYGGLHIPAIDIKGNHAMPFSEELQSSSPVIMLRAHTGIFFKQAFQPCSEYYLRKSSFYRSLVPVPAVSSLFDSLTKRYNLTTTTTTSSDDDNQPSTSKPMMTMTVGVHLRHTFPGHDVPEVDFAGGRYLFNESSPADTFFEIMEAITTMQQQQPPQSGGGDGGSAAAAGVRFLVSSNHPPILDRMRARLAASWGGQEHVHTRVLTIDEMVAREEGMSSLERTSKDGIQRALLDMLLLARCSAVVHPFGSSFAEEASHFHLVPSLQLLFNMLLHGVDTRAEDRYCHNMRFVTEARMLVDPHLTEAEARALEVEPCHSNQHQDDHHHPSGGVWRGLGTLCMPTYPTLLDAHTKAAAAAAGAGGGGRTSWRECTTYPADKGNTTTATQQSLPGVVAAAAAAAAVAS